MNVLEATKKKEELAQAVWKAAKFVTSNSSDDLLVSLHKATSEWSQWREHLKQTGVSPHVSKEGHG